MTVPGEGEVIFDEKAMFHNFQSWDGQTGRFIAQRTERLESLARISAGFDTGALIASIKTDYGKTTGGDLEAKVGANPHVSEGVGYALYHHEGTKPHVIVAKRGRALRFAPGSRAKTSPGKLTSGSGSKGSAVVFRPRVNHPGTKARLFTEQIAKRWRRGTAPFIRDALERHFR